jgi:hypothetical protein
LRTVDKSGVAQVSKAEYPAENEMLVDGPTAAAIVHLGGHSLI